MEAAQIEKHHQIVAGTAEEKKANFDPDASLKSPSAISSQDDDTLNYANEDHTASSSSYQLGTQDFISSYEAAQALSFLSENMAEGNSLTTTEEHPTDSGFNSNMGGDVSSCATMATAETNTLSNDDQTNEAIANSSSLDQDKKLTGDGSAISNSNVVEDNHQHPEAEYQLDEFGRVIRPDQKHLSDDSQPPHLSQAATELVSGSSNLETDVHSSSELAKEKEISQETSSLLVESNSSNSKRPENKDLFRFHPTHSVTFVPPPGVISKCPAGSRMFVGNLTCDRITKDDVATIFVKYGSLHEIVLKSNYGFIQFDTAEACQKAIQNEQGRLIAGAKIGCSISKDKFHMKPEKNAAPANRRNEHERFGRGDRRAQYDPRDHKRRQDHHHNNRHHSDRRDRSRSPPRRSSMETGLGNSSLPLPQRPIHSVPEVQILILDEIERRHINRVEARIRRSGFHVDNMFLSPKLSFRAVIRQLTDEGVKAVVMLERFIERRGTLSIQTFTSTGGVKEYENVTLDEGISILKQAKHARTQQQKGHPSPAQQAPAANNIISVLSNLASSGGADAKTLMTLANAIQQQQNQQISSHGQHKGMSSTGNQMFPNMLAPNAASMSNFSHMIQPSYQVPPQLAQQQFHQQQQQQNLQSLLASMTAVAQSGNYPVMPQPNMYGQIPQQQQLPQHYGRTPTSRPQGPPNFTSPGANGPSSSSSSVNDILSKLKELQQVNKGGGNTMSSTTTNPAMPNYLSITSLPNNLANNNNVMNQGYNPHPHNDQQQQHSSNQTGGMNPQQLMNLLQSLGGGNLQQQSR